MNRRHFLAGAGALPVTLAARTARSKGAATPIPFRARHQAGIATPQQSHTYFAAYDLVTEKRADIEAVLRAWTLAVERMTKGDTAAPLGSDLANAAPDGGAALGLAPGRLTVTLGFGPGLFVKDGHDRYGLAAQRPAALADLPKFNGDQLEPGRTGGDLSVQASADDPQVAFHAVRELERIGYGAVQLHWAQSGFVPSTPAGQTPRNLMGFKDGTNNPVPGHTRPDVPRDFDAVVWVGSEGPDWMRDGTYLVTRRIRISLEHWDRTETDFQEETIGRHKYSGAPIGKKHEGDALDLGRETKDGAPVIAEHSHVRLGAAAANGGAQIFRRAYSYNDGTKLLAERWPPWRQGTMYDAGLFLLAYQRDPRTGFTKIFENMAKFDMLNQYTTHTGSGLFACPGGAGPSEFIGQRLFDAARSGMNRRG